ncbi:helix-turn-helix domain-containing protein [Rhodanobacter sp. Si-c]|uniref:Helix-turn-helix domain-containing protein n=1 Tax=Rhodanobacter lycopersici TaxID=3162487 RepID=A0ABV3QKZ8_9GAMM
MNATPLPRLYTETEAAEYLGKSVITLRRWRRQGRLESIKIGQSTRFTETHLLACLKVCTCPASSIASPTSTPSSHARVRPSSTSSGGSADEKSAALRAVAALKMPSGKQES